MSNPQITDFALWVIAQEDAKLEEARSQPNCRGTLLYLIGERSEDYYAGWRTLRAVIESKYTATHSPIVGDIAAWEHMEWDELRLHVGLVVDSDGPIIRSRLGHGLEYPIKDLPPGIVQGEIKFKVPTRLQYYTLMSQTSSTD